MVTLMTTTPAAEVTVFFKLEKSINCRAWNAATDQTNAPQPPPTHLQGKQNPLLPWLRLTLYLHISTGSLLLVLPGALWT